MNFIYFISDGSKIKIGVSKTPDKRLKTLQTGNPNKLEFLICFESVFAYSIEKVLHRHLDNCRKVGEWFEIEQEQVYELIEICHQTNKNLEFIYLNPIE